MTAHAIDFAGIGRTLRLIAHTAVAQRRRLLRWGLIGALVYQCAMLIALVLRFGDLPNYVEVYNWPGNVWRIVQSTPAWGDVWPIVAQEWLIEVGYMDYDYGLGLSVWALAVVPAKVAVVAIMGALAALAVTLARGQVCATGALRSSGAATTLGAGLVLMTNATMSWVVCCATPSWVVGLAMLGLGVSTSLALEDMGGLIATVGFALLSGGIIAVAWARSRTRRATVAVAVGAEASA
jgi:hypothetical protein